VSSTLLPPEVDENAKAERRELLRAKIAKREELTATRDEASRKRFAMEKSIDEYNRRAQQELANTYQTIHSCDAQLSHAEAAHRELIVTSSLAERIKSIEEEIHETQYPGGANILLQLRSAQERHEQAFHFHRDGFDQSEAEKICAKADKIERHLAELRSQLTELVAQAIAE
jgi:hypothetical protein